MTTVEVPLTRKRLGFAEAVENPCLTCSTSPCCRYLPLGSFPVDSLADLDYAAYLLNFDDIEVGISAEGSWSAYYRQPCRFLDQSGGGCTLHGRPEKPHICVQYNPYSCWYRPALTGPEGDNYLRVDRRRLDRVLTLVAFDEARALVEVPTWEELVDAFSDLPIAAITDVGPPPPPDGTFDAWRDVVLLDAPARTLPRPADPALVQEDPCNGCGAHCCTSIVFPVASPTSASSLDYLRFALGFPGTELVISGDTWSLAVRARCRHLAGGRCSIFGAPERPLRCQFLDAWTCSFKAAFEEARPEHVLRVRLEEFPALLGAFRLDGGGNVVDPPDAAGMRLAVEGSFVAADS